MRLIVFICQRCGAAVVDHIAGASSRRQLCELCERLEASRSRHPSSAP